MSKVQQVLNTGTPRNNKTNLDKSINLVHRPKTRLSLRKSSSTEIDQGLDQTLSQSNSCGTPPQQHPNRKKPYTRRSLRGKSQEKIILEDPKLTGILLPVISLKRVEMRNNAEILKKTQNHLWAPLKTIASASNGEIAKTLGVSQGQLDSMSVSELLVFIRNDSEPLTAVRQKNAELNNSDPGATSSGYSSGEKAEGATSRKRNTRMSCKKDKEEDILDNKEVRVLLNRIDGKGGECRRKK